MLAISVEGELMCMDQVCQDNGPLLDCSDVGDGDFAMKTWTYRECSLLG